MNTLRFSIVAIAAFLFTAQVVFSQKVIFISPGRDGDGSSWKEAASDLQAALKQATSGTQIWVAEGLYFPTDGKNRSVAFEIGDGVALFGGFVGTEKKISERETMRHPTILSGNIGSEDPEDNSYNVLRLKSAGPTTVIDGFIITGGFANGTAEEGHFSRSGGGLFNDGSKKPSNPQLVSCAFLDNFAKDGGAIYNYGRGGEASPTLKDCEFSANVADFDGGAVNNDGRRNGQSNPVFVRCHFESNKGNYGGALFFDSVNGASVPTLTDCTFFRNAAWARGGAIFHITTTGNGSQWSPDGVVFEENEAFYRDSADFGIVSLH